MYDGVFAAEQGLADETSRLYHRAQGDVRCKREDVRCKREDVRCKREDVRWKMEVEPRSCSGSRLQWVPQVDCCSILWH